MIKATDLRVGNYVYAVVNGYRGDIIRIMPLDILAQYQCEVAGAASAFLPVNLSTKILQNCGFSLKEEFTYVYTENSQCHVVLIGPEPNSIFRLTVTGPFGMVGLDQLQFVHQLQNVMPWFIGRELEINLKNI